MKVHPVITCEHGGNRIPPAYRHLFEAHQELLETHRGYDFGALQLARDMAKALHAPLFTATVSRLLVDLNRSVGNPSLHSEATRLLPASERRRIVDAYWRPHREAVESHVREAVAGGACVVHVASHSFTPELNGQVRNADIGLLYDPRRPGELELAGLWRRTLVEARPELRVRLNYPYAGKGDGLTNTLRREHAPDRYVGIEFELNQRHVTGDAHALRRLRSSIVSCLKTATAAFAEKSVS